MSYQYPPTMSLHKTTGLAPPTVQQFKDISDRTGLRLTDDDLEQFKDAMDESLQKVYSRIDELADEHLPVKYPRTPGYRPQPEDNKHNAWFYKCDIRGADQGKLIGKRIVIKDNILVAGVPMANGSQLLEGYVPDEDATIVTRILDEGGRITGKANCENLCYSGSSCTSAMGPVLNPKHMDRSAGGSSSGSAALVKSGEVDMAIGGDQGGSVRIPASFCGLVGLKPTYGLVPYTGAMSLEPTLDHLGPITKTVRDAALLLEVIAGYDNGLDFRQHPGTTVPKYSELLTGDISGMKIGVLTEGFESCEWDIQTVCRNAVERLKQWATVEDVSIKEHKDALALLIPLVTEGAYKTMVQNAGGVQAKGHHNLACMEHLRTSLLTKANALPYTLKMLILHGTYISEECGLKYASKAHNLTPRMVKAYNTALEKYDVLVMPTVPYMVPLLPKKDCTIKDYLRTCADMTANTGPFNLTGHPALTVCVGYYEHPRLPIGLQIVGKHFREDRVMNVGYAFEQTINCLEEYEEF